jgi:hypothetical protein
LVEDLFLSTPKGSTSVGLFALVSLLGDLMPARRPLLPALVLLVALLGSLVWGGVGSSCSNSPLVTLIGLGSLLYSFAIGLLVLMALSGPRREARD